MTYSVDFRKKVLLTKEQEKLTFSEVSKRFCIGSASVEIWSKKIGPKRTRTKSPTKIDWDKLEKDVQKHPLSYQYERAQMFGISRQGIGYALKRLKIAYKKNFQAPKSQ
jgi:transposase